MKPYVSVLDTAKYKLFPENFLLGLAGAFEQKVTVSAEKLPPYSFQLFRILSPLAAHFRVNWA